MNKIKIVPKLDLVIYYLICGHLALLCTTNLMPSYFVRIALFLAIIRFLIERPARLNINTKHLNWIAFVMGMLAIATIINSGGGNIIECLKDFRTRFINPLVIMFIIIFFIREKEKFEKLLLILICSFIATNIYAIYQALEGMQRVNGLTDNSMALAGILILLFPLSLSVSIDKGDLAKNNVLFILASIIAIPVIFFNATRGAWLTFLIIIPIIGFSLLKNTKRVFVFLGISLIVSTIFFINPVTEERAETIFDSSYQSNSERKLMWESAWNMFLDHPVSGVGIGNYITQYRNVYIMPEAKERQQFHAHNVILQLLAESGLMGCLSYIGAFTYFIVESFKKWYKTKRIEAFIFFIATLGFLLQGITEVNFGHQNFIIEVYWVILAIYLMLGCTKEENV